MRATSSTWRPGIRCRSSPNICARSIASSSSSTRQRFRSALSKLAPTTRCSTRRNHSMGRCSRTSPRANDSTGSDSVNFLAPAFLAGLAAVAVPVLIHLINRERKVVVEFPSLMFLQRIPYRSVRRQKIRHILLLLLRCFAVAVVVAAFARPFFERRQVLAATGGARELVVLLDRSSSMGYGDRWNRARDAARKAFAGLSSADRGTLVLFAS